MKSRQIRELFMEANLIPETVQNKPGSAIREEGFAEGFARLEAHHTATTENTP